MNPITESNENIKTETPEKSLIAVTATISAIGYEEKHEVVMLARDDFEIEEKLRVWIKCTRKGCHLLSWEKSGWKGMRKRAGNENRTDKRKQ